MTRYSYAGGAADFVFDVAPSGFLRLRPAALLVWADETGGARVTDLRVDGAPVTSIPVDGSGLVPAFEGPDEFVGDLWVATGPDKPRIRLTSNAGEQRADAAADRAEAALETARQITGIEDVEGALEAADANPASPFRVAQDARLAATIAAVVDPVQTELDAVPAAIEAGVEAFVLPRNMLNILDYGVSTGTTSSQTTAIKAALDANVGQAFYFPPGSYRLDTGLSITARNSLILAPNARIYAGAAMTTLITYSDPSAGYAEDRAIVGGTLDGNLLANRILSIGGVIRFTLTQVTFKDGINRGLVTEAGTGAEVFAYDLRFHNTTDGNVADNIAIEANMGDCHFRDIVVRDWTTGIKDTAANTWDHIHPWIGPDEGTGKNHMTARYPTSIAYDLTGKSELGDMCLSDTYRYAFKSRTNGTGYTAPPRLSSGCRATWAEGTLPNALATANPAYVLDNSDGVGFDVDNLSLKGHANVPGNFLLGGSVNLHVRNTIPYGYVKGAQGGTSDVMEYGGPRPMGGIQQGERTFTPTLFGTSDAGGGHGVGYTHTYTTQTGRMQVVGNRVDYFINIVATVTSSTNFAGSLRIGGLPMPAGATSIRDGVGVAGGSGAGVVTTWAVIPAGASAIVSPRTLSSGSGDDVLTPALRGTTVRFMAHITTTALKSS